METRKSSFLVISLVLLGMVSGCAKHDSRVIHDASFRKARTLFDMDDFEGAISYYTKAIEKHPQGWVAYLSRAVCYCKIGKYDEAVADIEKARELYPDEASVKNAVPHIYALRGWHKWTTGDAIAAIRDLDHAVDIAPQHSAVRVTRGRMYLESDRFREAISEFNVYLGTNPGKTHRILVLIMQGRAYLETGSKKQAIAKANEVLKLAPHLQLHYEGEYAVELLNPAVRRRRVTRKFTDAQTAEKKGKLVEALRHIEAAYGLQPVLDVPEEGPEGRDYTAADLEQIEDVRKALARIRKKMLEKQKPPQD